MISQSWRWELVYSVHETGSASIILAAPATVQVYTSLGARMVLIRDNVDRWLKLAPPMTLIYTIWFQWKMDKPFDVKVRKYIVTKKRLESLFLPLNQKILSKRILGQTTFETFNFFLFPWCWCRDFYFNSFCIINVSQLRLIIDELLNHRYFKWYFHQQHIVSSK